MRRAIQLSFMLVISILCATAVHAQDAQVTESADEGSDIFDLSLEELMSIEIFSASRQQESSFDVPLSSFVVTRKEIELSGATSIVEALRIVPGVIVREISHGCYDVSLRGGIDGNPSYGFTYVNASILVMIDNRPVFNYFQGGTFWQNLPVGMAEIERIEVVHGPVSTLYGPNAVSGVINILTTRPEKDKNIYGNATGFAGTHATMGSAFAGANLADKWAVELAFNYEQRQKFEETLYDPGVQEYIPVRDFYGDAATSAIFFPDADESVERLGATFNLYFQDDEIDLKLSGAHNNSNALYPFATGATVVTVSNESENIGVSGDLYGFSVVASYLAGTQGLAGDDETSQFDYAYTDLYLDYIWTINDMISLRPAIGYQSAHLDDTKYTIDRGMIGNFNGEGTITNFASSLKLELSPWEQWRFIVGGRYDKFNYPDEGVLSYQGIVNYNPSENHLFRFVTGRSYNSSFLGQTLVDVLLPAQPGVNLSLQGNTDLDLVNNTLYELGYRTRLTPNTILDVALFQQQFEDFNATVTQLPTFDVATNTVTINLEQNNLPLTVRQRGATVALQATLWDSKLQIRPNVTYQQTQLLDYSPYYNVEGAYDMPAVNFVLGEHVDKVEDVDSEYTPDIFGGVNIIVNPVSKLNINISSYYFSSYVIDMNPEVVLGTGQIFNQDARNIDGKVLLNANINYAFTKNFSAFVYGNNLLNIDTPEGFGADRLGIQGMIGLRYRL